MAELAQHGPDTPPLRSRRTEQQAHEARVKFWRVAIVTSFFAILIGGSLLSGAIAVLGSMKNQAQLDSAAKHATAKMSRPMLDGVFCHLMVFDNSTGQTKEDKIERCDKDSVAVAPARPGHSTFVWGGK